MDDPNDNPPPKNTTPKTQGSKMPKKQHSKVLPKPNFVVKRDQDFQTQLKTTINGLKISEAKKAIILELIIDDYQIQSWDDLHSLTKKNKNFIIGLGGKSLFNIKNQSMSYHEAMSIEETVKVVQNMFLTQDMMGSIRYALIYTPQIRALQNFMDYCKNPKLNPKQKKTKEDDILYDDFSHHFKQLNKKFGNDNDMVEKFGMIGQKELFKELADCSETYVDIPIRRKFWDNKSKIKEWIKGVTALSENEPKQNNKKNKKKENKKKEKKKVGEKMDVSENSDSGSDSDFETEDQIKDKRTENIFKRYIDIQKKLLALLSNNKYSDDDEKFLLSFLNQFFSKISHNNLTNISKFTREQLVDIPEVFWDTFLNGPLFDSLFAHGELSVLRREIESKSSKLKGRKIHKLDSIISIESVLGALEAFYLEVQKFDKDGHAHGDFDKLSSTSKFEVESRLDKYQAKQNENAGIAENKKNAENKKSKKKTENAENQKSKKKNQLEISKYSMEFVNRTYFVLAIGNYLEFFCTYYSNTTRRYHCIKLYVVDLMIDGTNIESYFDVVSAAIAIFIDMTIISEPNDNKQDDRFKFISQDLDFNYRDEWNRDKDGFPKDNLKRGSYNPFGFGEKFSVSDSPSKRATMYNGNNNPILFQPENLSSRGLLQKNNYGYIERAQLNYQDIILKVVYDDANREKEANILTYLKNTKNVINIYGLHKLQNNDTAIVMPFMKQYDIYQSNTMQNIKKHLFSMLKAICGVHEKGIIHSDIKPENFLINSDNELVLIDFGLSFHCESNQNHFGGTYQYMSREVDETSLGATFESDVWSVSVILAQILTENNFVKADLNNLKNGWRSIRYFREQIQDQIKENSELFSKDILNLIDLFCKLSHFNIDSRISAKESLEHKFFQDSVETSQNQKQKSNLKNNVSSKTEKSNTEKKSSNSKVIQKSNSKNSKSRILKSKSDKENISVNLIQP